MEAPFQRLIQHNQARLYALLFSSATATLLEFGRHNLQATLGISAVLHTWGQNLRDHYHLHCVVSGGGLSLDGANWVALRPTWLFPVRALSVVFRPKFRDALEQFFEHGQLHFPSGQPQLAQPAAFARWLRRICRRKWVVYTKRPCAGPSVVLAYLSRYTHRVAITNLRLEALDPANHTAWHSFCAYRVAATQDVPRTALEAGNSASTIVAHYRALATGAEGKAWFAITRSR